MDKQDIKNLKLRYLVWLYKTTKEALDRIERKFTQLEIDRVLLKELKAADKNGQAAKAIADFSAYIANKEKEGLAQKCEGKGLKPDCYFLSLKLEAIERVIAKETGAAGLKKVKSLYEKEMTERILKSTEH
jgi:hypothetical protein